MENKNAYKEEKFDSYLNKTIILSSRTYFKKQMNTINKERTIVDDVDYLALLQDFVNANSSFSSFDDIDSKIELSSALSTLSVIEQAVIFLLFQEDLTQNEVAEILKIYSKTVSKIKNRAMSKLKRYLKGDLENEK